MHFLQKTRIIHAREEAGLEGADADGGGGGGCLNAPPLRDSTSKGSPFVHFFVRVPLAPIYTSFEMGARRKMQFLVKFFQNVTKNAFLAV